jgi:tripartite-type tricarboxylate transporter receptor subunit TctC
MNKVVAAIAACAAMAAAFSAHAQTPYPSKPVRLLIPFPPGGPTDSAVRVFLPVLSEALGQPFSIVNMAGSHGALAPTALLKEPPDGHTLLVGNSSPLVAVPILRKDAPYDPVRDFAPVSLMGWTPLLLVVTPDVPAKNLAELIADHLHHGAAAHPREARHRQQELPDRRRGDEGAADGGGAGHGGGPQ